MAIEFTEQQTRVLQARKHNILVSAAAGSGKTAVLVERIVRMISEGDEPMNIDRLLVVTFTKAAAAQMRERIGAAIASRIEEEPDNVHLQKQETLLHNAQITTMDSFFTFLLRNNFSDIDMDPGFRQMDQTEAELMRKDAMEEFLEEGYAQEDPSLKICADYFCRGAGDRELEEILETLYKQAVSHPDPVQWLRERASDYHVGSREELYSTAWMQFIILTVAEKIEDLKRQYERLLDYCSLPDGPALYIEGVKNNIAPYRGRIGLLFDRYGRIDYIRYSQLEDAIGEAAGLESSGHKRAAKETQRAVIFLEDMLANGPVEHTIIKQKAAEAGISLPTLNRAKKQCGMTSKRLSRESSVWR